MKSYVCVCVSERAGRRRVDHVHSIQIKFRNSKCAQNGNYITLLRSSRETEYIYIRNGCSQQKVKYALAHSVLAGETGERESAIKKVFHLISPIKKNFDQALACSFSCYLAMHYSYISVVLIYIHFFFSFICNEHFLSEVFVLGECVLSRQISVGSYFMR